VDYCSEKVIGPVHASMDGEQKADQDLVGKHNHSLQHMKAVSSEGRGYRRPGNSTSNPGMIFR
jgi:hypothetical protein